MSAAVSGVPAEAEPLGFERRREIVRMLWVYSHPERDGWTPPFDIGKTGPKEWDFAHDVEEMITARVAALREQIAAEALGPVRALVSEWSEDANLDAARPYDMLDDLQRLLMARVQAPPAATPPRALDPACTLCGGRGWLNLESSEPHRCPACAPIVQAALSAPVQAAEGVDGE